MKDGSGKEERERTLREQSRKPICKRFRRWFKLVPPLPAKWLRFPTLFAPVSQDL